MSTKTMELHIFFASDETFSMCLTVAIASIVKNAKNTDLLNFYILEDNISKNSKEKINKLKKIKNFNIEYIKINNEVFKDCPQIARCKQITRQTYYRYIIPKIKPNLDKVLYLDCDLIVLQSLSSLWNTDLSNNYCAVIQELSPKHSKNDAERLGIEAEFNAGVMLINNKKWVDENITPILFKNTETLYDKKILLWQDQDVLNYTFNENVKWINPQYNYQQNALNNAYHSKYSEKDMQYAKKNIVIIHYNNSRKPWKAKTDFYPWIYYKYMFLSGFYFQTISIIFLYLLKKLLFLKKTKGKLIITVLGVKFKFKRKNKC